MEQRAIKLQFTGNRLVPLNGPEASQTLLGLCITAVITARQELDDLPEHSLDIDYFFHTHLGQVLQFGFGADEGRWRWLSDGRWGTFERFRRIPGRRRRRNDALEIAISTLFMYGLRLLGHRGSPDAYNNIAFLGRACYNEVAHLTDEHDIEHGLYRRMARQFKRHGVILNRAAVELNFVETLPPGLIT